MRTTPEAERRLRESEDFCTLKCKEGIQAQKHILEMIATGCPLADVLKAVCLLVEEQQPGLLCSLLLLDEKGRRTGKFVGPNLPTSYVHGLRGLAIDPPYIGTCAETLDSGRSAVVPDVESDQQYSPEWRAMLLDHGLRCCHSIPILGHDGKTLASFALYRREPGEHRLADEQSVEAATHLAGIAIERMLAEERLRLSEGRLRLIFKSAKDFAIITTDPDGLVTGWNSGAQNLFGYDLTEIIGRPIAVTFTPEDRAIGAHERELEMARTSGRAEDERWHIRHDGTRFWASGLLQPLQDNDHLSGFVKIVRDRTEARLTRERLQTSEERLRSIISATTQILWRCNPEGKVDEDSPSWREFTGQSADEIKGTGWQDALHPDDRERTAETLRKAIREARSYQVEFRVRRRDGEHCWMLSRGAPVLNPDGTVREWIGTCTDISEQRQAQDALRFQLDLTKGITDNATTAIFMMDIRGHCTFMNPAAEEMIGFTLEEIKDGSLHDFIHHHRADGRPYPMSECPIDRALPENFEVRNHEDVFIRKNGELFPVLVNARVIKQVDLTLGTVIEVRDITAERAAAEALRRQKDRATRLVESNIIGVIFANPERIFEANDAFLEMIGYNRADLEAGRLSWREMTPPEWAAADNEGFREILERGTCTPFQKEYFRKDGSRIPVILGAATISMEPLEWVGFVQDISQAKEVEEELRAADRRKDEFLAILAHELRNPLAPIRNAVHILKTKGPPVPELAWCRDIIDRQVGHMSRLLDDLLDVSRITRNKIELRKERVTLARVIDTAIESSRPLIDGGGHTFTTFLPQVPVFLNADPVRLAQVFANLLNNAAKYTERGGRIELVGELAGEEVIVTVSDNGMGITPELQPRLFEMFSQADTALERSQGGLGIGLALVKGLVEMHGGTVTAHSDGPGKGSDLVVRLPVVSAGQLEDDSSLPAEKPPAVACRILVADDNQDAAESLAMVLELLGSEVRTAANGQQAYEIADAFRPEVVLMDIGMPVLNGYEAAKLIRAQPWASATMLVALTGWGQEEDKRLAREAGFDHHLVKPVRLEELRQILAEKTQRSSGPTV